MAIAGFSFTDFEDAIHSPHVTEINNCHARLLAGPKTSSTHRPATIQAYLRYQLLTTSPRNLPHAFDEENFDFYGRISTASRNSRPAGSAAPTP